MMGGKIWIESELGKGATFAFTVQVRRGEEKGRRFAARGVRWDNARILAVDDDPDTLAFYAKIMKEFGISCDTAESGPCALELVDRNGTYDIYFLDWQMPGMDGIQLAGALQQKAPNPDDISLILCSAALKDADGVAAKEAGIERLLTKPLFPYTVLDAIYDCLGVEPDQPREEEPPESEALFAGRRVLLAEDVEINREVVLALLEPTHLEIDCAENGAEAVRMFRESPEKYDVIFMDVQMPEMDGYEATRSIRALDLPRAKNIPIIAMTANVFREDVEKCLAAGMDSHVGKPLNVDEVLEKLRTYLPQQDDS
jgi:CheY-like chemotaxis protein